MALNILYGDRDGYVRVLRFHPDAEGFGRAAARICWEQNHGLTELTETQWAFKQWNEYRDSYLPPPPPKQRTWLELVMAMLGVI